MRGYDGPYKKIFDIKYYSPVDDLGTGDDEISGYVFWHDPNPNGEESFQLQQAKKWAGPEWNWQLMRGPGGYLGDTTLEQGEAKDLNSAKAACDAAFKRLFPDLKRQRGKSKDLGKQVRTILLKDWPIEALRAWSFEASNNDKRVLKWSKQKLVDHMLENDRGTLEDILGMNGNLKADLNQLIDQFGKIDENGNPID